MVGMREMVGTMYEGDGGHEGDGRYEGGGGARYRNMEYGLCIH